VATSIDDGRRNHASQERGGLAVSVKLPCWATEYIKLLAEMERWA
jgi:hypothetical protein